MLSSNNVIKKIYTWIYNSSTFKLMKKNDNALFIKYLQNNKSKIGILR